MVRKREQVIIFESDPEQELGWELDLCLMGRHSQVQIAEIHQKEKGTPPIYRTEEVTFCREQCYLRVDKKMRSIELSCRCGLTLNNNTFLRVHELNIRAHLAWLILAAFVQSSEPLRDYGGYLLMFSDPEINDSADAYGGKDFLSTGPGEPLVSLFIRLPDDALLKTFAPWAIGVVLDCITEEEKRHKFTMKELLGL